MDKFIRNKTFITYMKRGNLQVIIIGFLILLVLIGPSIAQELTQDTDNDGLPDDQEAKFGTDPLIMDTDNDGLNDNQEVQLGTNPLAKDTDGDGMIDSEDDFPLTERRLEVASSQDIKQIANRYAEEFPYEKPEVNEESISKAQINAKYDQNRLRINIEDKANINLEINKEDKTGIRKITIELPQ